ncbi:type II secretion system protein [Methylomonas koyamae]|nr:type II secretion system protein [Methylomonas koyamae]
MDVKVGMHSELCASGYAGGWERGRAFGIGIQRGFSLLETVLVLFLMALVASAGLMLTEGVEDQAKYDETKRRMELIRKAIVGDATRTINGMPEIGGFVADMGRLPNCLRELAEAFDCTSPGNPLPTSTFDSNSGLLAGWRGPYIALLPDSDGELRIRDGYENDDGSVDFGWGFANDGTQIQLQSFGLNSVADGGTPIDDYPVGASITVVTPLINPFDYSVTFQSWASVTIRFANTGSNPVSIAQNSLRLVLSFADDSQPGSIGTAESAPFPAANLNVPTSMISVAVTNGQTLTVPSGTTLSGNALSFTANDKLHFVDGGHDVIVTNGSGAEIPAGSTLTGQQVTIGSDGFVELPSSTQLTLVSPFASLPDTMGHFSLSIVCNDPANPNAVDGKRYDGDCTRYGTDAAPVAYTPTNQPYLFRAAPRGTPILPPSPLTWTIR